MKPQGHVITSAALGAAFWAKSRDPWTMALSLAFGVLVDLDHFIDYWYAAGRLTFNARDFLAARYFRRSGRIFIFFHGWEYLPLVFVLWQAFKGRKWAITATGAMSSHILADHLANDLKPLGYFVWYRAKHRFRAAEIMDWQRANERDLLHHERQTRAAAGKMSLAERIISLFV